MIKKRIRQFLAGICTILVLPIGPVCEVFAKEEKQENSVSTESISQSLKLWYTSPSISTSGVVILIFSIVFSFSIEINCPIRNYPYCEWCSSCAHSPVSLPDRHHASLMPPRSVCVPDLTVQNASDLQV